MAHDINVEQKQWSPRMMRLTAISNREVAGGAPQPVFVDPYCVALAVRSMGFWNVIDGPQNGRIECTTVWLRGGGPANVLVVETPTEVALIRDRALEVPVDLKEMK